MTDCSGVSWTVNTDSAMGGVSCEWVLSTTDPSDLTSPLEDWEAIADPTVEGFSQDVDPMTLCVTGVFIWILSHLNMAPAFVYLRIHFIPIDVPVRIQKKVHTTGGSGGGSG